MRVIVDINVLLSAFIKEGSPPNLLVQAWMDGRFDLLSGALQIEEITIAVLRVQNLSAHDRRADSPGTL